MHDRQRHQQLGLSEDELVLPGAPIIYRIVEYPTLLDSSNIEFQDWNRIALDIQVSKAMCRYNAAFHTVSEYSIQDRANFLR